MTTTAKIKTTPDTACTTNPKSTTTRVALTTTRPNHDPPNFPTIVVTGSLEAF